MRSPARQSIFCVFGANRFFCFIEAKAGSNAAKSGGLKQKRDFWGIFGHVSAGGGGGCFAIHPPGDA